jgi:hypothetical protein
MRTIDTETPVVSIVTGSIRVFIWTVVTCVWAVFGFIFWIPFLARTMATYSTAILVATYTGAGHGMAEHGLRSAIEFYPRGFQRINHLLRTDATMDPALATVINLTAVIRFLLEASFAALFWGSLLFTAVRYVGLFEGSALDRLIRSRTTSVADSALTSRNLPSDSSILTPDGGGVGAGLGTTSGAKRTARRRPASR